MPILLSLSDGLIRIQSMAHEVFSSEAWNQRHRLYDTVMTFDQDVLTYVQVTGPMLSALTQMKAASHAYTHMNPGDKKSMGQMQELFLSSLFSFACACEFMNECFFPKKSFRINYALAPNPIRRR